MPSLEIDPKSELKFKGPFNDIVTSEIMATNHSARRICFKVKTTAPKQYCVRPNCGYVDPGQTVIITIMLQPIDLTSNEKLKHKFLIQSLELLPPYPENPELVWKTARHEDIGEHKLKCVFETERMPEERTDKKGLYSENPRTVEELRKQARGQMPKVEQTTSVTKSLPTMAAAVVAVFAIVIAVLIGKFFVF